MCAGLLLPLWEARAHLLVGPPGAPFPLAAPSISVYCLFGFDQWLWFVARCFAAGCVRAPILDAQTVLYH